METTAEDVRIDDRTVVVARPTGAGPRVFQPLVKLMHAGPEPVAAADAWQRIEAFFAEHLGSSRPSS